MMEKIDRSMLKYKNLKSKEMKKRVFQARERENATYLHNNNNNYK